jgi:MFS transporter, FSR family, fosmidomycin resistance protein
MLSRLRARGQRLSMLVVVLLLIELLDELVFGVQGATFPLIRDALSLSYVQIGILLSVPGVIASFIEPFLGILGDTRHRKSLIVIGGIVFTIQLLAIILSQQFLALLMAFIILYPASGTFVNLAQATLMDIDPARHEHNMARWTFFGSMGVVGGPLLLTVTLSLGLPWQAVYILLAIVSLCIVILTARYVPPHLITTDGEEPPNFRQSFCNAVTALRQFHVMRWVILLEFSDLLLDVLLSYLALYFVDVVGLTPATGAIAISVWTGVGLVGDFAIMFLLERVDGLTYLRISAILEFILYGLFLLVDDLFLKIAILGLLGFFNAGWYSVLQGRLYSSLPGQSGLVMVVNNFGGLFGALIPLLLGVIASQWGLEVAMWFILLGPIVIFIGLPWRDNEPSGISIES